LEELRTFLIGKGMTELADKECKASFATSPLGKSIKDFKAKNKDKESQKLADELYAASLANTCSKKTKGKSQEGLTEVLGGCKPFAKTTFGVKLQAAIKNNTGAKRKSA
jgi:hypothetical protein